MKTRGRNCRVVFIVLSVLQILKNNEYRTEAVKGLQTSDIGLQTSDTENKDQ